MSSDYIVIAWNTKAEIDVNFELSYKIALNHSSRATYEHKLSNVLSIFVDNIWFDTQNFDDFVKGLSTIIATELSCIAECRGDSDKSYCRRKPDKISSNCVFLEKINEILNTNYNLSPQEEWNKEIKRRINIGV